MKIGIITRANSKGQIVIPKKYREQVGIKKDIPLNIVVEGSYITIHPVKAVFSANSLTEKYLKILKQTQGSWAGDDWQETEKKRRTLELKATKKNKQVW